MKRVGNRRSRVRDVGVALFTCSPKALPIDSQGLESFSGFGSGKPHFPIARVCSIAADNDETDRVRHSALAQFVERARSIVLVSSPKHGR